MATKLELLDKGLAKMERPEFDALLEHEAKMLADERRKALLEAIGLAELERNAAINEGCEDCAVAVNRVLRRLRALAEGKE